MNSNKLNIVLYQFKSFLNGLESFFAAEVGLYSEEFQIRTPLDLDNLFVFGADSQQDLFNVVAVCEELDAPYVVMTIR